MNITTPNEVKNEEKLEDRLAQLIANESVSSFARQCGVGESLFRKYLKGSIPNANNLVLIADTAGVSVDWLATGRLPRNRCEIIDNTTQEVESDEFYILNGYRVSNEREKKTIRALIEAIQNPSAINWYRLGEEITKIATLGKAKK